MLIFSGTVLLISASLMSFTKKVVKKIYYKIPLALLFALLSCFIYFKIFLFTFRNVGSGESGMIFGGILGVLGSLAVGFMSIFVNFFILSKNN